MAKTVMALRRRLRQRDIGNVPRAAYPPGWDVPAAFNFTRDVVEAYAANPLRSALTYVDREGIVDRQTFAEVAGDAARWAHLLRTRLDRGDRVMIVVGKVPAWHGAMLGAIKGGLVAVPCPNMLRARDLAFRVRDSGARLVIADRECEPEIEEMRNQIGDIVAVLYLDEAKAELSRYRGIAPTEETTAGESALILYTSGTTKEPKGVVHTHAYTWAQRVQAGRWLDAHDGDVVWCTAGTGWAKAVWNVLLGPWSHGAEVVVHESGFEPEERLSLIQKLGITVLCQAPTEYRMMAKLEKLASAYAPRLRHAVSAGEPLNPEVIATFQDAFGLTVHDGYGQTENSLLIANMPGTPVRPGSMGLPTEGHDVAVIDEAGNVCAAGAEGEIALLGRPPTLFRGYWNDPDATDAAFRDGWYVTGDRAIRDEEGYLWFVGRADDVILSSAYRIGPFEVESALLEHPAVAESAVVGVPDAERGQIVKAFVVLRPGQEASEDLAVELQDHVKAVTAPYKYPRAISFVEELPKTTSGKIRRAALRETGDAVDEYVPASVAAPLRAVPDLAAQEAESRRLEAEEIARRELARERARAAAAEAERSQAELAARRAAEEAERSRVEAEELYRIRALVEEQAREEEEAAARARADAEASVVLEAVTSDHADAAAASEAEAEAAERARLEAEAAERARSEAEEAERARAEAEAAEQARLEAEAAERARLEAEAAERARLEAEEAERARLEAEEAERARAEAEAAEQARLEAEAAERSRLEAEEAERARAEAEAAERARLEAEEAERARLEAEEAERARLEAEAAERARLEAEEAERARAEAEAAERSRLEAEEAERARAEAEAAEQARLEAEAAERARLEAEEAERARTEAEAAERARLEAEAAERARLEAEEAERARAEAEAAEQARLEAEERARLEAEEAERARAEAEAAERARLETEAAERARIQAEAAERALLEAEELAGAVAGPEVGEAQPEHESRRDARRRKREEAARQKAEAEAAKRRAKEEAEQRKRDEDAARAAERQRVVDEKEAAKHRAAEEKRRAEEEKIAAKQRAIEEKRRAEEERLAAKRRVEDEKREAKEAEEQRKKDEIAAREEAKRLKEEAREAAKVAEDAKRRTYQLGNRRRGLGRLLPSDEPEDDYGTDEGDESVEPIIGIVERLAQYSGMPSGTAGRNASQDDEPHDDEPPRPIDIRDAAPLDPEAVENTRFGDDTGSRDDTAHREDTDVGDEMDDEQLGERRSAP